MLGVDKIDIPYSSSTMAAAGPAHSGVCQLEFRVQPDMSGFIQPGLLFEQLQKSDIDGFNDRQLFDCPKEIDPMYGQLQPLSSTGVCTFKEVFDCIKTIHQSQDEYVCQLSQDCLSVFTRVIP